MFVGCCDAVSSEALVLEVLSSDFVDESRFLKWLGTINALHDLLCRGLVDPSPSFRRNSIETSSMDPTR
jgi:hypothetical protein